MAAPAFIRFAASAPSRPPTRLSLWVAGRGWGLEKHEGRRDTA